MESHDWRRRLQASPSQALHWLHVWRGTLLLGGVAWPPLPPPSPNPEVDKAEGEGCSRCSGIGGGAARAREREAAAPGALLLSLRPP